MLGAIIGDIIGSPYEFDSDKTKNFPLFIPSCRATDDSVLTVAVGVACASYCGGGEAEFKAVLIKAMREIGRLYPDAGYGARFYEWLMSDSMLPYGGKTNGSAMRVSPVAYIAESLGDAELLAKWSAEITHNHPEGIKGAQAVASAVYLALNGANKSEIRKYVEENYYSLDFTLDSIRPGYKVDLTCEGSVPQGIMCFLESTDFEDAVRNAVSLGGDGDTLSAIAGAIAEAYYGIPEEICTEAFEHLDSILAEYYSECVCCIN